LDAYIVHVTSGFLPTDGADFASKEDDLGLHVVDSLSTALDFSKLKDPDSIRICHTAYTALMGFALRGAPTLLGTQRQTLVELGIARITGPRGANTVGIKRSNDLAVAMDEPLAIAACLMFFKGLKGDMGLENFISEAVGSRDPIARGAAFESAIMVTLAKVLDGTRTLGDICDIHTKTDIHVPRWAYEKVQLVSVLGWEGDVPQVCVSGLYQGASPILAVRADSPEGVHEWSKGCGIPFLCPDLHMGPDIWAMVQINSNFFWLALQSKCLALLHLPSRCVKKAVKVVTPKKFYLDKVCF
jgi:hypothetical protein